MDAHTDLLEPFNLNFNLLNPAKRLRLERQVQEDDLGTFLLTFQTCVTPKNPTTPVACSHCCKILALILRASKATVGLEEDSVKGRSKETY